MHIPSYRCNVICARVRVQPLFISYKGSHSYKKKLSGMLQRNETGEWREPLLEQREHAMEFPENYTQVAGVTERHR